MNDKLIKIIKVQLLHICQMGSSGLISDRNISFTISCSLIEIASLYSFLKKYHLVRLRFFLHVLSLSYKPFLNYCYSYFFRRAHFCHVHVTAEESD